MTPARTRRGRPSLKSPRIAAAPVVPPARQGSVHIDIQRMTLHGYTQVQQQRFMQAFETAVASLASNSHAWSAMKSIDIPRLAVQRASDNPEEAAQQLVRQLFDEAGGRRQERDHG